MAAQEPRRSSGRDRSGRIWVEDGDRRRPFMRGIMVHSLMARGVAFEDAYLLANTIRDRLRSVDTVTKPEIARAVSELLGDAANPEEQALARRMLEGVAEEEYAALELSKVGYFFGEPHVVATARRGEVAGVIVVDEQATHWYPAGSTSRPLGPTEAYHIHKGRRILRTFNP